MADFTTSPVPDQFDHKIPVLNATDSCSNTVLSIAEKVSCPIRNSPPEAARSPSILMPPIVRHAPESLTGLREMVPAIFFNSPTLRTQRRH